jgi:hypothetical protein
MEVRSRSSVVNRERQLNLAKGHVSCGMRTGPDGLWTVQARFPANRELARRYPNFERAWFEPSSISSNEDRMVLRRYADADFAPDFRLGLAPVFQFVPAHATAFLENLVGTLSNGSVNFAFLFFGGDGNDQDIGIRRG